MAYNQYGLRRLGSNQSCANGNFRHPTGFGGFRFNGSARTSKPVNQYTNRHGTKAAVSNMVMAQGFLQLFSGNAANRRPPTYRINSLSSQQMISLLKSVTLSFGLVPLKYAARLLMEEIKIRDLNPHGAGGNHHLRKQVKLFKNLLEVLQLQHRADNISDSIRLYYFHLQQFYPGFLHL